MAKTLDNFDFRGGGRPPQYPWDDWLNGDIWELHRGEDYEVSDDSMRAMVRHKAKNRGLSVKTSIPKPGVVVFQARPK